MKKLLKMSTSLLLPAVLFLSGCTANNVSLKTSSAIQTKVSGMPFEVLVEPETFALSLQVEDDILPVSNAMAKRAVSDFKEEDNTVSWVYPDQQVAVSLIKEQDYLNVEITSHLEGDNTFTWPYVSADHYYLPLGEGKRVPADDTAWQTYLDEQEFSVLEQLSMPFWLSSIGEYSALYIMENPYRTQLNFSAEPSIAFSVSHEYPEIDENRTNRYRIYITDDSPVTGAKLYRNYVIEKGDFATLEQKAEDNPDIRKLYGAPFIYLWGDFVISADNINWPAFRQSLSTPIMNYIWSFSEKIENGGEVISLIEEIKNQDYVADYHKHVLCDYISQVVLRDDFWQPAIFTQSSAELDAILEKEYENLSEAEKIQAHKYALAANLPEVFVNAQEWMDSSTLDLFKELKEKGVDQAWVGLNSWEQAYVKPELVEELVQLGYLIASYDSYHSIHAPGKDQWITARFPDAALYDEGTVANKDGEKIKGFQNVGRKLNPTLSLPYVKERMDSIMANQLPFNSWFIDCDATGEIYDDYTPEHITTQQEDLAARLERMAFIRDDYNLVVGSEGGHDFSASTISYAHGIELKSFSWMDDDMKSNQDSQYFLGKYYNPEGGVADKFAMRVPVKEQYYTVFVNPQYDVPLFKLVYNDSLITSYHWDWSTFKIQGATQDRMIREVLYNVPSLYHLDKENWERYQEDIVNHQTVLSKFSQQAVTQEMTDFSYLVDDGGVQKTVYGQSLIAVANFSDSGYQYEQMEIPAHSVLIQTDDEQTIYTPSISEENR